MIKKHLLGQFFTTNVDFILQGFEIFVNNKDVTDPFCGNMDLLNWAKKHNASKIIGYDIDEQYVDNNVTFLNDSIKNPLKYDFILTNPPYLYKNKLENKSYFINTQNTDLYQISLEKIMDSNEGIVIVPINFLSSENSKYIRIKFLDKFNIVYCKYFTNQIFNDTTYNVMAFYYKKKSIQNNEQNFIMNIQPNNIDKTIKIYREYNWQIGGEFLKTINMQTNNLKIKRLLEEDIITGDNNIIVALNHLKDKKYLSVNLNTFNLIKNNIILLKAIDTGSQNGFICLEDIRKYNIDCLISLKSSRNQIYLVFQNPISISEQEEIIKLFNQELQRKREEYFSLFMTNFRDNNRKRISFDFAYKMINYIYYMKIKGVNNARQYSLFERIN